MAELRWLCAAVRTLQARVNELERTSNKPLEVTCSGSTPAVELLPEIEKLFVARTGQLLQVLETRIGQTHIGKQVRFEDETMATEARGEKKKSVSADDHTLDKENNLFVPTGKQVTLEQGTSALETHETPHRPFSSGSRASRSESVPTEERSVQKSVVSDGHTLGQEKMPIAPAVEQTTLEQVSLTMEATEHFRKFFGSGSDAGRTGKQHVTGRTAFPTALDWQQIRCVNGNLEGLYQDLANENLEGLYQDLEDEVQNL